MARKVPQLDEPRYTNAGLAAACGVSPAAISEAKKVGRIKLGADGKYGPEAIAAFHASRMTTPGPGRRGKAASDEPDPEELLRWRIVSEREKALKARLERRALQGSLVKREAVEAAASERAALVRDRLRQVGPKLAAALASESEVRRCRDLVCAAVDAALEELTAEVEYVGVG